MVKYYGATGRRFGLPALGGRWSGFGAQRMRARLRPEHSFTGPEPSTTAFVAKAKDLQALSDTVVDAASVGAGLWFSYLFVLLYIAIAAGSVTHRDLLFESPVKLPFLNVDLPLKGFFVLGPLLFLIVHAHVLLHFVLLADKVGAFHAELEEQIAGDGARARLRRQLPSDIFVQFPAGPREVRTGIIGFLLRLIAQISLVGAPIALLVLFDLQFLPYHDEVITWWQRFAMVIDLALVWILWPSIARGETTRITWRDFRRGKIAIATLAPVLLVTIVATFPGEWLDRNLPPARLIPIEWPDWGLAADQVNRTRKIGSGWTSLHELLVAGEVDLVTRKPTSLFSNRLVVPGIDVIDHAKFDTEAKIAALPETLSLRGRRLEGVVLPFARLRKTDFTGAHLQDAIFVVADLREARFGCDGISVNEWQCADLRGATLEGAHLQGAPCSVSIPFLDRRLQPQLDQPQHGTIRDATSHRFEKASLVSAQLQGVDLAGAQLQGASLDGALLQGANLETTQLQGASLANAQLQGANLNGAQLQGAELNKAQLEGASLQEGYQLLGSSFASMEELWGPSLEKMFLSGPRMSVQLQGASLDGAQLRDASLSGIFVWRADVGRANGDGAYIATTETGPKYQSLDCPTERTDPCEWSVSAFAALKRLIEQRVPEGGRREAALRRIDKLDPTKTPDRQREVLEKAWADLERLSPATDVYEKRLLLSLQKTGCDPGGAPYVIQGLISSRLMFVSDTSLATHFLDEAHCAGARGLSETDKSRLRKMRD
jgi:uncharacterized protein YjbI with pentapeptide repeats